MRRKVKIELRPYDALAILSFMQEYVNDENKHDPTLAAIHETVESYRQQIYKNMRPDQIEDAMLESKVNYITERHPSKH